MFVDAALVIELKIQKKILFGKEGSRLLIST
jgi:GTPase Era involved in 16S rRNA processing